MFCSRYIDHALKDDSGRVTVRPLIVDRWKNAEKYDETCEILAIFCANFYKFRNLNGLGPYSGGHSLRITTICKVIGHQLVAFFFLAQECTFHLPPENTVPLRKEVSSEL